MRITPLHSVLVFSGQQLTDTEQMAFRTRFGPLETTSSTSPASIPTPATA